MKPPKDFMKQAREIIFNWEPEGDLTCATDCDALNSYDALGAAIAALAERAYEMGRESVVGDLCNRCAEYVLAPTPGSEEMK